MKIGKVVSIILIVLAVICFFRAASGFASFMMSHGDEAYLEDAILGAPLGIIFLIAGILVKNKSNK